MKLRHPALIRCAALLLATVIRVWMGCVRKHIAQFNAEPHPSHPRRGRVIYAFWHEDVLFGVVQKAKIRVLVSQHSDGDLIARTANHLGRGAVRGSSTRGGSAAILEMVKRSDGYQLGVTPDGPRGPRRRVQLGVVFLASQTGRPVGAVRRRLHAGRAGQELGPLRRAAAGQPGGGRHRPGRPRAAEAQPGAARRVPPAGSRSN